MLNLSQSSGAYPFLYIYLSLFHTELKTNDILEQYIPVDRVLKISIHSQIRQSTLGSWSKYQKMQSYARYL